MRIQNERYRRWHNVSAILITLGGINVGVRCGVYSSVVLVGNSAGVTEI